MAIDSDSISLVISKKPLLKSQHQVVYPDENPYGEALHDIFCSEMRLTWLFKTILHFNRHHSFLQIEDFKDLLLEGQAEHFRSAREIKKLMVRQRFISEYPKTPFRRAYVISLYSALALPAKPRFALIKQLCKSLEFNLLEKYLVLTNEGCPISDRTKLEELAERTETFYQKLKRCTYQSR